MMKKALILMVATMMTVTAAKAQDTENRLSLYLGAGIEKELNDKFSAGIDLQGRFCGDPKSQEFLIRPSVEFSPVKYFSIGAEYRWDMEHDAEEKTTDWQGRLGLSAKGKVSINHFKLEARVKYCNYSGDYAYWDTDKSVSDTAKLNYLRFKIQAGYKIKPLKMTPYISYELFDNLTRGKIDRLRYTVGVKKKLGNSTLSFEYMLYQKFSRYTVKKGNRKDDINGNIFALSYKYTIPYKPKETE